MKVYTVKEFAKKLRVCEGSVYERVKVGQINKIPNLGRTVRIPASEINNFKQLVNTKNYFTYDESKVIVIETHLGKVRKVKNKDEYVITDLVKLLNLKDSYSVVRRLNAKNYRKIGLKEAKELGLYCNQFGLILINYRGIVEYSRKSRSKDVIHFGKLLKELKVEEYQQTELQEEAEGIFEFIESAINKTQNSIQILEQKEVLGQAFNIYGTYERPLFLAKDVAEWIGMDISNASRMIKNVDEDEYLVTRHNKTNATFLTEDGLYEVLMQSRKPMAKQFKKQIKVILKDIRLTGGYVANETKFVNNYFNSFSPEVRRAMIEDLKNRNKELFTKKEEIDKALLDNIKAINEMEQSLDIKRR